MGDEKSEEVSWALTLICRQKDSMYIPQILKEIEEGNEGTSFEIKETRSFGPVFDESLTDVVLKIAPIAVPLVIEIMKALLKRLYKDGIRTDYKERHKLAAEMLSDKAPLLLEEATDSHYYSRYVFKTVHGKYVWEYDKGEVNIRQG